MSTPRARTWLVVSAAIVLVGGGATAAAYALRHACAAAPPSETVVVITHNVASPEVNETAIAQPIEALLAGLPDVASMRTESRADSVTATLVFGGSALGGGMERTRQALAGVAKTLPEGAAPPLVTHRDRDAPAGWIVGEAALKQELERTPGVARVEICGARSDAPHVFLDPEKLAAHAIEIADVVLALGAATSPSALLQTALPPIEEITATRIATAKGEVPLLDVGVVSVRPSETDCALARTDRTMDAGAVVLRVVGGAGADPKALAKTLAGKASERGASWIDPASTLAIAYVAPSSRSSALVRAAWLADHVGPRTVGALLRTSGVIEVIQTIDPSDEHGARAAAAIDATVRRDAPPPAPAYAGIISAPKAPPDRLIVTARESSLDALAGRAEAIARAVGGVDGVGPSVGSLPGARVASVEVVIDREAAAREGVPAASIARAVQAVVSGIDVGGVVLHVGDGDQEGTLRALRVKGVPLERLARLERRSSLEAIVRVDRQRAIELVWEVTRDVRDDVKRALRDPNVSVVLERY